MTFSHGIGGYTNHRCRCDICRAAQRDYMRMYYEDHPEYRDWKSARAKVSRAERNALLAAYRVSALSTFTDGRMFGEALIALDEALAHLDRLGYFDELPDAHSR